MEKEPVTPIGKGEQIRLVRNLDEVEDRLEEAKEVIAMITSNIEDRNMLYEQEMTKPEWARSKETLESIKTDFEKFGASLDNISEVLKSLNEVKEYALRRYKELEKRKEESGF